jgi:stage V sporulation protein B
MKSTSLSHGAIYITIASIIFVLSGYLINIILGRQLGPASYGIYGIIITLMTAVNLTQTSGLPQAVAKFIAENETKAEGILKSGLILQLLSTGVAALLLYFFAYPIAELLKDRSLIGYIQLSSLVFPFYGIYSIYLCYYNGLHYFKTQALLGIAYALIKLFSIIILVYIFHVYGAILGFIVSPVIALFFWFHFPKNVKQSFPYKKLLLFSLPLIALAIFGTLLQSVDLFFIKALLHSDKYAGLYTANQNIAEIPFYAVPPLSSVLFPSISRSVKQKLEDHTKNIIGTSLRLGLLIIIPSILLISATSSEILTFLYSSSYVSGASALAILVIGDGAFTIFTLLSTIMSGAGFPIRMSILIGIGVLISSLLCIFLVPRFGIVGAALSTTIAAFWVMIFGAFVVYHKFKVLINPKSILKILIASLIIYLLAKVIILPVLLLPILYIFLFAVYFGMLFLLGEITDEDITLATSLISKFIKKK